MKRQKFQGLMTVGGQKLAKRHRFGRHRLVVLDIPKYEAELAKALVLDITAARANLVGWGEV